MTAFQRFALLLLAVACSACAPEKRDPWADIDYSSVYKAAGENRDIDSSYKRPTVLGCVDDDLFNCK